MEKALFMVTTSLVSAGDGTRRRLSPDALMRNVVDKMYLGISLTHGKLYIR